MSSDLVILAIDCSMPQLSVALTRGDALLGAVSLEGKDSRNEKLLPAVDWVLRETAVSRDQLGLFAVARGPGSFTGVRIALATVQGLAAALDRPVCAMSTHEAASLASAARSVLVHGNAGRGEFYASGFREGREVLPPSLLNREGLLAERSRFDAEVDLDHLQPSVALLAARRARALAEEGRLAEYCDLSPLYVRLAEAEVKLQQRSHG